jgi:hypothetical protein
MLRREVWELSDEDFKFLTIGQDDETGEEEDADEED